MEKLNQYYQKAVKSCENSGEKESDHFVGVTKLIEIGKGGVKSENLPPSEDVKKVQRRIDSTEKKILNDIKKIKNKTTTTKVTHAHPTPSPSPSLCFWGKNPNFGEYAYNPKKRFVFLEIRG